MGFALSGIGLLVLFILLEIYRAVRTFSTDAILPNISQSSKSSIISETANPFPTQGLL